MIEIRILDGAEARDLVDPFYVKNRHRTCARDLDIFFLAVDCGTVIGCVRYCAEEGPPMLRPMMIDAAHRRRGIGSQLLWEFERYLESRGVHDVYGLPYAHLDGFYAAAGFQRVPAGRAPEFVRARMRSYDPSVTAYLFMRRP